jgi:hypothetical protein
MGAIPHASTPPSDVGCPGRASWPDGGPSPTGQQSPTGNQPPTGQQPSTGSQPPGGGGPPGIARPPVQSADLEIALDGEGEGSKVEEGENYDWEALVKNHGPGVARDVKIIVSTPHAFDLDKVNHDGECETNPEGEGRMVCSFGDLSAGAQIELKFSGEFRQDRRFRTHVFVESTTPDSDPTNNNDKQRFKVHENERPKPVGDALACGSGPVTLIGGDSDSPFLPDAGGDEIDVVSDLEVRLNGQTIFEDDDGLPNSSAIFGFGSPLDRRRTAIRSIRARRVRTSSTTSS